LEEILDEIRNLVDLSAITTDYNSNKGQLKQTSQYGGLSKRNRMMIQNQMYFCYRNVFNNAGKKYNAKIFINVKLNKKGLINLETAHIDAVGNGAEQLSEKDYNFLVKSANSIIGNCNPLRNLPVDRYDIWKNLSFVLII
jgi:hypothetical protein